MGRRNSRSFADGLGLTTKRFSIAMVLLSVAALWGATASAQQTLTWGPSGVLADGSGTWDTGTTSNWWNSGVQTTWSDTSNAVFGVGSGAAGTVTINGIAVSPNSLTFNATGDGNPYTITGGSIDTGSNTSGSLPVNVNVNAAIASPFTGSGGLAVTGPGTLTLSTQSTYAGATVISGGANVVLAARASFGLLNTSYGTAAGLVNYYPLNGNTNDIVGGVNGVVSSGASVSGAGGVFGQGAVYLNGTGTGVTMGALPTMNSGTQARTISAWVEQVASPAGWNSNFFGFYGPQTIKSGQFYFDNNGTGPVLTQYYDDTNPLLTNAQANGTWHLLTATWDGNTNDAAQVYLDGQPNTTLASNANGGTNIQNVFGLGIGRTGLQANLSDVRVYNTALSAAQVLACIALRLRAPPIPCPSPRP